MESASGAPGGGQGGKVLRWVFLALALIIVGACKVTPKEAAQPDAGADVAAEVVPDAAPDIAKEISPLLITADFLKPSYGEQGKQQLMVTFPMTVGDALKGPDGKLRGDLQVVFYTQGQVGRTVVTTIKAENLRLNEKGELQADFVIGKDAVPSSYSVEVVIPGQGVVARFCYAFEVNPTPVELDAGTAPEVVDAGAKDATRHPDARHPDVTPPPPDVPHEAPAPPPDPCPPSTSANAPRTGACKCLSGVFLSGCCDSNPGAPGC